MSNQFRNPQMRNAYDTCMKMALDRDSEFYVTPKGARIIDKQGRNRRTGASHRCYFWQGYDDAPINWDAYGKSTLSYAAFRAGQDFKKIQQDCMHDEVSMDNVCYYCCEQIDY